MSHWNLATFLKYFSFHTSLLKEDTKKLAYTKAILQVLQIYGTPDLLLVSGINFDILYFWKKEEERERSENIKDWLTEALDVINHTLYYLMDRDFSLKGKKGRNILYTKEKKTL